MSLGKKFVEKKVDLSETERLDALEAKLPVFIEKIQAYDEVLDKFKQQSVEFAKLQESNTAILAKLGKAAEKNSYLENLLQDFSSENAQLKKDAAFFYQKTLDAQGSLEKSISNMQAANEKKVKAHQDSVAKTLDACVKKAELQANIENIKAFYEDSRQKMDLLSQRDKEQNDAVTALLVEHDTISKDWADQSAKIIDFTKILEESKKGFKSEINGVYEEIERKKKEIEKAIEAKGLELRDYIDMTPSSIEYVRKEFNNKLQLIQLDSENALQKSNNNEKALKILEKKMENIILKQKKLELDQ